MRLGGPIPRAEQTDPASWVDAHRRRGYRACYIPALDLPPAQFEATCQASREADLVIAEVGIWNNPIDSDEIKRRAAIERCQKMLELADRSGARCCVNLAGSRGPFWMGPFHEDLTEQTFDLIVQTVREIIDAVKPKRAVYTLETMPWMFPDSVENYARIFQAIDRKQFGVHFDPVNLLNSPMTYFHSGRIIRDFVAALGPHIRSCHAKDMLIESGPTQVRLNEVMPGTGVLAYDVFLAEIHRLDPDMPLLLEHLETDADYARAAGNIRSIANKHGVPI